MRREMILSQGLGRIGFSCLEGLSYHLPQCWPRLQCFWITNWFFLHNIQKGLGKYKGQIRQPDKQAQLLERLRANIHNAEKSWAKEAWLSKRIIGLANLGHDWGKKLEFWYRDSNLYLSQVPVKSILLLFLFSWSLFSFALIPSLSSIL